jgi:hypothetical protein
MAVAESSLAVLSVFLNSGPTRREVLYGIGKQSTVWNRRNYGNHGAAGV